MRKFFDAVVDIWDYVMFDSDIFINAMLVLFVGLTGVALVNLVGSIIVGGPFWLVTE